MTQATDPVASVNSNPVPAITTNKTADTTLVITALLLWRGLAVRGEDRRR
jgi:hypothetical protein